MAFVLSCRFIVYALLLLYKIEAMFIQTIDHVERNIKKTAYEGEAHSDVIKPVLLSVFFIKPHTHTAFDFYSVRISMYVTVDDTLRQKDEHMNVIWCISWNFMLLKKSIQRESRHEIKISTISENPENKIYILELFSLKIWKIKQQKSFS